MTIDYNDSSGTYPSLNNDSLEFKLHFDDIADHVCVISNLLFSGTAEFIFSDLTDEIALPSVTVTRSDNSIESICGATTFTLETNSELLEIDAQNGVLKLKPTVTETDNGSF